MHKNKSWTASSNCFIEHVVQLLLIEPSCSDYGLWSLHDFQAWELHFGVDWGAYHCWSGRQLEITSFLLNCMVVCIYIFFNPICKWNSIGCLSWSSFSFHSDGTFYLWETNTWTSEPWSSTSGFVTVNKNDICQVVFVMERTLLGFCVAIV